MVIKTGDTYVFSFNTQEAGGTPGFDSPKIYLKNVETNKYYNGITYQTDPYYFDMIYVSNYNYIWETVMNVAGNFIVSAFSSLDSSVTKEEEVEVYDLAASEVAWVKNNPYTIYYGAPSASVVTIKRSSDNYYYTGGGWDETETELTMHKYTDTIYQYTFTPTTSEMFECICSCQSGQEEVDDLVINLNVFESEEDIATIKVTSQTLLSPSGTNCVVVEDNGMGPIGGASVDVYTYAGKERVASASTNSDGTWELSVAPGTYIFIISKDGYESVTFTRTV